MSGSTKVTSSSVGEASNRNGWVWGFTLQSEIWNGRLAMIGFVSALLVELVSGQGVLHFWNLI